jgi:hypothetical protein
MQSRRFSVSMRELLANKLTRKKPLSSSVPLREWRFKRRFRKLFVFQLFASMRIIWVSLNGGSVKV